MGIRFSIRSGNRSRRLLAWLAIPFLGLIPYAVASEIDVSKLACDIAPAIAKSGKRAAVVDFVNLKGDPTDFGRYLAEELSVALPACGPSLNLADRTYVKAILAENKLSEKGLISPATARHAAQLIGADLILIGTVTPFGGTVRVTAKLLGASDGSLVASAGMDLPRTAAVDKLLEGDILKADTPARGSRPAITPMAESGRGRVGVPAVVKDFAFELTSCRFERGNLECVLRVRNLGEDSVIEFSVEGCGNPPTRMIDDRGNEYLVKVVRLGTKVDDAHGSHSCSINNVLAANVPMGAVVRFENVAPVANIVLLEIPFRAGRSEYQAGSAPFVKAQFHDVQIQH
jgi:TolB-like protein